MAKTVSVNGVRATRIDQLTGLRFFAAFLVFLTHLNWEAVSETVQIIFKEGYVGVSFFFVLSGFVLSYSYKAKLFAGQLPKLKYIALRYARLLPLHLLTMTPYLLLYLFSGKFDLLKFLSNATFTQSWVPSKLFYFSYNGPSWSLSNEMFFYFCFIGLVFLKERTRLLLTAVLFSVIFVSAFVNEQHFSNTIVVGQSVLTEWLFYIFPVFRLLEFLVGMAIYDLWKKGHFAAFKLSFLAIPLLLLAMYWAHNVPTSFRLSLYYLPFVIFLLVSHLTEVKTLSVKLFSNPTMKLLGEASFAFYLIHKPIILLAHKLTPSFVNNPFLFGSVILITTSFVSIGLYKLFEKPVERYLKKRINSYRFSPN